MTNMAMAMARPGVAGEMKADASPSLTSSAATRSEESRLRRSACDGLSAMPTTCEAWRISSRALALERATSRSIAAWSPTRMTGRRTHGRGDGALDDDCGAVVAPHRVHRDLHAGVGSTTPLRRRRSPGPCSTRSADRPGAAASPRGTAGTPTAWARPACSACGACGRGSSSGVVWAAAFGSPLSARNRAARSLSAASAGRAAALLQAHWTTLRLPPHTGHRPPGTRRDTAASWAGQSVVSVSITVAEVQLVVLVEVHVEIVGAQLDGVGPGRGTSRTSSAAVTSTGESLDAAPARL